MFEYDGTGPISPEMVGAVFQAAWLPYVDRFSSMPAMAALFRHYTELAMEEEFSSLDRFREVHVQPGRQFFVALVQGQVAGHVAVKLGAESSELWRMAVSPTFAGRGVARQLNAAVTRAAVLAGSRLLFLTTGNIMTGARALYDALGYELVSRTYEPAFDNLVCTRATDLSLFVFHLLVQICRYEMPLVPELRWRYRDSVLVARRQPGGGFEVLADFERVLGRAENQAALERWLGRPAALLLQPSGAPVRICKMKERHLTAVRQMFAAAWQVREEGPACAL